jgi:nucleoside transporter
MPPALRLKLSLLMFLQFGILGLWAVPLPTFLKAAPHEGGVGLSAGDIGLIYSTLALGATLSPLFVGLLADRLFATQRVLAVLHLAGALLLGGAWWQSQHFAEDIRSVFLQVAGDEWVDHRGVNCDLRTLTTSFATQPVRRRLHEVLFEEQRLLRFLRNPSRFHDREEDYSFQSLLEKFGIVERPLLAGDNIEFWGWQLPDFAPHRLRYLQQLRAEVQPVAERFRNHPEVVANSQRAVPPLFALLLIYSCLYLPTITLASSLSFRNLPDPAHQFSQVRVFGTVGWIAAGLFVGFALPAVSPLPLFAAAVASLALAVVSLLLPHTPPAGRPKSLGDALGLPALKMLADRSFLVFVLTALASSLLMAFHNVFTNPFLRDLGVPGPAAAQTLGQYTEVLGILLIPFIRGRIGTKWLLLAGLLASAARFLGYAAQTWPAVLAVGLPLHGIGFSFFYITAAIYVDRQAPPDLRASAQGLVTLLTVGAGALVGNWFAGRVVDWHTVGGAVDWGRVWLVPALGTLAAAGVFGLLFREPAKQRPEPDSVPDIEVPVA